MLLLHASFEKQTNISQRLLPLVAVELPKMTNGSVAANSIIFI